ncbi:FG-GAP repeat domain-containing protein, partial [Macromonas bipunctata]|uniref:FG-GAP repeat domain-containing protein n=1 Tax=Macromonas bipunctata TaxID=183670 RepID=UPI00197C714F
SYAAPTFADIDGDGDLDAFVGDQQGNTLFFRNTGTASNPSFAAASYNSFGLADVGTSAAPTFADIDGDGDLDAFVGEWSGNTLFFRNTGNASSAAFAAATSNPFGLTDVGYSSSPTLADIDGDGDLDAFIGNYDGVIKFFENIVPPGVTITPSGGSTQVTEGGATDTYTVVLDSAPTADVTITLDDTNGQVTFDQPTLTFTTANWNAAQTVTVTARNDTVGEGTHTGTIGHTVTSTDGNYNNLAVKPLIVTITDNDLPTGNPNFLQYTGATSAAPFGLSDVGLYASPTLVDIDGDGDLDAFVGAYDGNTQFFRNTGNASSAAFAAVSTNPWGLSDVGFIASPTFVDIDADGDLDAFVGDYDGNTQFFRNTGNASSAAFAAATSNPFGLTDVGSFSLPTFADIDADGDLDAFIGVNNGNTLFFRNTGNASSAAFAAATSNPFGLTDVGSFSSPTLADIDADGDLDAFIGENIGNTLFFRNTGNASSAAFAAVSTNPWGLSDVGFIASPTFVDIDADGDLDAFIGNDDGVVKLFLNVNPGLVITPTGDDTRVSEGDTTGDTYTVQLATKPTADVVVTLDDTNGQVSLSTTTLTFTTANWNVAQTVTVTAVDDTVGEGTHTGVIGHTVTSTDTNYNNLAVKPLIVTITDNDVATHPPVFVLSASSEPFGLTDVGNASA